jgi:hypothetical protein
MKQRSLLLTAAVAATLFSCTKDTDFESGQRSEILSAKSEKSIQALKFNTFYGPQVQMGNGKARSFITISHTGVPEEIGMELTSGALTGLPTEGEPHYNLPLHQKAQAATPYDHLAINWNPFGHPPPGIYTVPHFDFHFYMISMDEQMMIPEYNATTAMMFDNPPAPGYLPANYIPIPGGVPMMGKHWVDVTSPELNGVPFTKTLIYGTFDGKVIFHEPMVTLAVIQSGETIEAPIPQAQYVAEHGTYYPTMYKIYMDAATGKHYVSFTDFVWR